MLAVVGAAGNNDGNLWGDEARQRMGRNIEEVLQRSEGLCEQHADR